MTKVFDTYKTSIGFHKFIAQDIPKGCIVLAACQDDMSTNLSMDFKEWFSEMGSTEIWQLEYRQAFAFIGVMGKSECTEKRSSNIKDRASVTQIFEVNDNQKETNLI